MTIASILPGAECRLGQVRPVSHHHRGMDEVLSAKEKEKEAGKVKEPVDKGKSTNEPAGI